MTQPAHIVIPADYGEVVQSHKLSWTVAELLAAEFPEPRWVVPGIIPYGLVAVAGRPKVGKSWLMLQVAGAVGTGGRALDQEVEKGKVLYLALEDSPRRLKSRLETQEIPATADLRFETEWPSFTATGLVRLEMAFKLDGYTMAVVDTLSRASGPADQLDIAEMTQLYDGLQRITKAYDTSIVIVDHHRKNTGTLSNPIDDIIGSTAKTGGPDAIVGLYRGQGKHSATFKVVGRDVEELELALDWDGQSCVWRVLGEAETVHRSTLRSEVIEAIRALQKMGELTTTARIAMHLGRDRGNISRILADLVFHGDLIRAQKVGRQQPYVLSDTETVLL